MNTKMSTPITTTVSMEIAVYVEQGPSDCKDSRIELIPIPDKPFNRR